MSQSPDEVVLEGRGLHSGTQSRVILRRRPGPIAFLNGQREVPLRDARVADTTRATTLDMGGRRFATVEHLLAAFGGLGIQTGVSVEVVGPELPLLRGGAREYADALLAIGAKGMENPCLEVVRDGEVRTGDSRYSFQPCEGVHVRVSADFGDARLDRVASWGGDATDFRRRIAPARTFAFAGELALLSHHGGAAHVTPESVIVLTPETVLFAGAPFTPDEPVRHKLLDLVGDLFVYGGPPRGAMLAERPGHGATHEVMREALARGIVRRLPVVLSARDGPRGDRPD
jgi:UDP-3-O-[3-hydroxymyristoyl] N-acetylglucosamine deacetylase